MKPLRIFHVVKLLDLLKVALEHATTLGVTAGAFSSSRPRVRLVYRRI